MSSSLTISAKNQNIIKKKEIEFPEVIWDMIKSYLQPLKTGDAFIISYNLFLQEHLNYQQYQLYRTLNNNQNIIKKNLSDKEMLQKARVNLTYTYAKNKWDNPCKNTYFNTTFIQVGYLIALHVPYKHYGINCERYPIHAYITHQGIITKVTKTYLTMSPLPKSKYIKEYNKNPNFTINVAQKKDVLWICKNHIDVMYQYDFKREIDIFKSLNDIPFNRNLRYNPNLSELYYRLIREEQTALAYNEHRRINLEINYNDNLFCYQYKILGVSGGSRSIIYLPSKYLYVKIPITYIQTQLRIPLHRLLNR